MGHRTILLNPGPVNLSSRTRKALTRPDLCHREVEFSALQGHIRSALLQIYRLSEQDYTSVLLTGSGTLAVEAMICSLVPLDGKLLVLSNGVYGDRMSNIAAAHGISYSTLSLPWGEEIDPAKVENALMKDRQISHVALVHHETTTGRLNDLLIIGRICKRFGKPMLLDAVSSFGAEIIEFTDVNIHACAVSANKCLHGAPGLACVVCRRELLEQSVDSRRSIYLDLGTHWVEQERSSCAFTPAVPLFYALDEALIELFDAGGQPTRHENYQKLATLIRHRMHEMGIRPYLTTGKLASSLTAFRLPEQISYKALHARLRKEDIVIYAGQGGLSQKIFRIANMGEITLKDLDRLFNTFSEALCELSS